MFRNWTKILPFFILEWLTLRESRKYTGNNGKCKVLFSRFREYDTLEEKNLKKFKYYRFYNESYLMVTLKSDLEKNIDSKRKELEQLEDKLESFED